MNVKDHLNITKTTDYPNGITYFQMATYNLG